MRYKDPIASDWGNNQFSSNACIHSYSLIDGNRDILVGAGIVFLFLKDMYFDCLKDSGF